MTETQKAAMQQALEALEWASDLNSTAQNYRPLQDSIAALRAALAELEPVAWGLTYELESSRRWPSRIKGGGNG